ncbi:MAG: LysM peptidoglycan-binding domain-containing protein, partial [Spirochaetes bacterium]
QLAVSPGSLSLIDDKYGVPRYSNILLVNDVLTSSEEYAKLLEKFGLENEKLDNILNQISKKNQTDDRVNFKQYERTDGTIFVTPRFYYKLQKGFGSGLNLKSTIKDQAFGWTEVYTVDRSVRYSSLQALSADYPFKFHKYFKEGIHFTMEKQFDKNGELKEYFYLNKIRREPVGLKNAMVVLDDAFIDSQENPESRDNLRKLRDFMDKAELPSIVPGGASTTLDMFVFNSSNKTLKPKGATLFDESGQFIENPTINLADHVIPMDMSLFKVQYNPYSTDTTTAVPRQILHFLSSIDNLEYADEAYTSLAALQNVIFQNVFGTGRIDEYKFKKILDESGTRTNDDFSIKNALDSGLSLQHPTVMQKIVTSLGASLNKLASRVRLPGGKLILRSDIGFTFERKVGNKVIKDRLRIGKTVDGTPYAEASIPASFLSEAQKKALRSGKPLFIVPDMFGFRIPSGDLNAGLLIKVVDYYDEKNRGNLVILPAEEILKQGWDFDVDALFLLSFVSNKANYNGAFVTIEQDTPTGFTKLLDESYDYNIKDSKQFETYEQNIIKEIQLLQKENNALIDKLKSKNTDEQTDELDAKVKANRKTIKMLQRTRENTLKNRLIKAIINAYLDPSNNHRILDVTTTEIVQQSIRSLKARGMYEAVKAEDLSDAMDNINMYSNVKESRTAIGIYAKGSGVTAYTRRASEEGDYPSIKNTFTFVNDKGKEILVKRIDPNITVFKTNNTSYSVNNKFLNAFLDALANPEIFDIAFTGANANLVDVGLSLNDVPFEAVLLLMNNPIIRDAVRNNTLRKLVQAIDELVYTTDEKGDKTYIPEYKRLKISLKDLSDANRKTKDSTLFENLVKDQSDTLLESETSDNDSQDESIDNVSTDKQTTVKEELAEANSKNEETTVNDAQIIKERIEQSHAAKQQAVIQSLSSMDKNSSIAKTLFLLHKLHSISQQKQKLIQLVNLPQDKPVSIADIFNFKIIIHEVFPISVQKALVIKFRNIPEMHTAEQFTKYVKKIIEEIREEHRGHIILPSMEIGVEKILDNNPHIAVALIQTLTHIDNLEKQFAVLSDKAVKIVNSNLPQSDKVFLDTGTRKFYGLMLLSDLITSVQASDIIDYEVVQYLKSAKTNPKIIETRGVAAFINDIILMLEAVYRYENIQASTNPNFKRNLLLQKLMWTSGLLPQIKTTESISVQSFEAGDYHRAFMALGHYELTPETNELGEFLGYKVTYARNRQDSPLLRNLTKYAILKYGLRGGSSNYINAIEPTYLAKMSTALNKIFDTYITNNRDISGITSLFALKVAHEYPNSVVDLGVYSKKESVTTSFTKEGKFALATIIEEFDRTGIEYDVIVREDNNNFPTVMAIPSRHRSAKPQFFMFITTVEINGQTIAIYQKTKYGDVILSPYPYNTVDHFRIDKPTIKFQTSLEFDIHSTTQIDENGNEVPNVFEYPYEEKFLKDKVKEYVYGTYYNDVVRHSVSLLKILNMDSYKEDGVLKFQVIETDIANKDYDPDTGTYVQKHTQEELNLQHYNDLKKFLNYSKRNSDRFPTQLELTENDVVVYITNSKNIPISSQAQRMYGSSKRMNTINVKDIGSKGYVEIGKPNQIVKGPVGYGYGLPLNYVPELNAKREDGSWKYLTETSYGPKKTAKAFVALIDAANNNPDKKFIVTINSSSNFKKLTPGELAKIFISTGRAIPSNIVFNESFYNIMELVVKTLDDKKKKAVFGDKVDVNALSEIDILTELSKDETAKKADEIQDDCAGGNKAEYGMSFGFTPGSQWEIVKDLKGPSHAQGGIDLSIDNGRVMFSDGKTKYHAANGLVLNGSDPLYSDPSKALQMFGKQQPLNTNKQSIYNYVIQKGDTLSALSSKFNTSVNQLVNTNQIKNPDLIIKGKILKVPIKYNKSLKLNEIEQIYHPNRKLDLTEQQYNQIITALKAKKYEN